jgi:hypothetical protein
MPHRNEEESGNPLFRRARASPHIRHQAERGRRRGPCGDADVETGRRRGVQAIKSGKARNDARGAYQDGSASERALVQLGNTLHAWREEIATMWRFTRNNGITEGFHTKMEVLNRQAYGFRNFQNYRLRVRVMCS